VEYKVRCFRVVNTLPYLTVLYYRTNTWVIHIKTAFRAYFDKYEVKISTQ